MAGMSAQGRRAGGQDVLAAGTEGKRRDRVREKVVWAVGGRGVQAAFRSRALTGRLSSPESGIVALRPSGFRAVKGCPVAKFWCGKDGGSMAGKRREMLPLVCFERLLFRDIWQGNAEGSFP